MKFGILSLAATAALALSSGTAAAQWGHGHHNHGHNHGSSRLHRDLSHMHLGPHLDYHNGHYHLHDGFYRSGPLYPVYPSYGGYSNLTPGFYSVPSTGSWSSYGYGVPYRGNGYDSYRWRW